MGFSVFNTALNTISKGTSAIGTGSQVLQGLKNPDPFQGISGILTATAGRSKLARKLLTIDSKLRDIVTKVGGIGEMFKTPQPPIKVWKDDPNAVVKQMEGRPDPQMPFDWYAEVISPFAEDDLIPSIYIEEIQTPNITISTFEVFRDGTTRKYVDGVSIVDIQCKFYLDIEGTARKFLYSWLNAQYSNKYGTYTGAFEYKKQISISIVDPSQTVSARVVLGGVFIREITSETFSTSGEPLGLQASLSVDTIEVISISDDTISSRSSALKSLSASDYRNNMLPKGNSLMSFIPTKYTTMFNDTVASAEAQMESAKASAVNKIRSFF